MECSVLVYFQLIVRLLSFELFDFNFLSFNFGYKFSFSNTAG